MVLGSLHPVVDHQRGTTSNARAAAERLTALAMTLLIGLRIEVRFGVTLGVLLAIALLPVWWPEVRRYARMAPLMSLAVAAIVAGSALTQWFADQGSSRSLLIERSAVLVSLIAALGGLLWARQRIGTATLATVFGVGMMASIPMNVSQDPNQWRFTYSIPIIVFVLAIASAYRGPGRVALQIAASLALATVGLLNDSRSNSAMLLLSGLVIAWQAVDHKLRSGRGGVYLLVLWAACSFMFVQSAILSGTFGDAIQARTEAQINQAGGNVLLGGRPEIAASVALIGEHPLGLGSGTLAGYEDIINAKQAMSRIGYDPNNGYVERFMFGNGIELHSSVGDYWLWFGPLGLGVLLLVLAICFRGVQRQYDGGWLTVLTAYLATRVVWDLAFSPASSGLQLLVLALALLARRPESAASTAGVAKACEPRGLLEQKS